MAKLTTKRRKALPTKKFALPGERKYPVDTRNRAVTAKAYAQKEYDKGNLSEADLNQIRRKANQKLYDKSVSTGDMSEKGDKNAEKTKRKRSKRD